MWWSVGKKPLVAEEDEEVAKQAEEVVSSVVGQVPQYSLRPGNVIWVSSHKKPLYYVNLAKMFMIRHDEVVLSALGMAISVAVIVSDILKDKGLATQKHILISSVDTMDAKKGRVFLKHKIEILMRKRERILNLTSTTKSRDCRSNEA